MRLRLWLALTAALLLAPRSPAADDDSVRLRSSLRAAVAQGADEAAPPAGAAAESPTDADANTDVPTDEADLPPVIVRPGPESDSGVEPTTPSPTRRTPPPLGSFNSRNYPGLDDERFDGLAGAARSDRSLFELPPLGTIIPRVRLDELAPSTTPEALEQEVGVLVQRTNLGGGSAFIRGLTGNQVLLMVDGIRLNNATYRFGPNQYLNTIDPGQIERIEIVRGPQSVLFGSDALGGVINVVTRSAERRGYDYLGGEFVERFTSSDLGSYSRVNVEGTLNRGGIFAGGSFLNLNDLDAGGRIGRQDFTGYQQYAGDVKFDYLVDRDTLLTVALVHLEQENVPRSDFWRQATPRSLFFDPQERDLGYIRWQGRGQGLIDAYMFTASYGRLKEGSRERNPLSSNTLRVREFDVDSVGMSLVASTDLDWVGRLTYGTDWYHDDVDSFRNDVSLVTGAVTPRLDSPFPNDGFYESLGTFLQWDVDVTDRLTAIAGVRYSHIQIGGTVPLRLTAPIVMGDIGDTYQDWTGSVGLSYELLPSLRLVGSIAEGFRAPNLDDTAALGPTNQGTDVPSTDLNPETSLNYEVGFKLDADRLRGQAFVYWTDLENLIVRAPGTFNGLPFLDLNGNGIQDPGEDDVWQRFNAGQATIQGFETTGEYLLEGGWSLWGNFSYIYGQNLSDEEPLSRIPPTQGFTGVRWRNPTRTRWFELYGWLVRRQDRLSARDVSDPRIPVDGTGGFGTVNLRGGTTLGRLGRLSLGLENIFDKGYRVHGSGIDGPGITATVGYDRSF